MKNNSIKFVAGLDHAGGSMIRLGMVVVFHWIGGLKNFVPVRD